MNNSLPFPCKASPMRGEGVTSGQHIDRCITITLQNVNITRINSPLCELELKQISEISGYPFEIHYPDKDCEPFRIVANYFKQL